jgi:hypothetical protein
LQEKNHFADLLPPQSSFDDHNIYDLDMQANPYLQRLSFNIGLDEGMPYQQRELLDACYPPDEIMQWKL